MLCKDVLKKDVLNEIFTEGLDASIQQSMQKCWGGKKIAELQNYAFHATFLRRLLRHDAILKRANPLLIEQHTQRRNPQTFRKSAVSAKQDELKSVSLAF